MFQLVTELVIMQSLCKAIYIYIYLILVFLLFFLCFKGVVMFQCGFSLKSSVPYCFQSSHAAWYWTFLDTP